MAPPNKLRRTATGSKSTRTAKGVLLFDESGDKPLHHITVQLFVRGIDQPVARGITGMDGSFEMTYDAKGIWPADLKLCVYYYETRYLSSGVYNPRLVEIPDSDIPEACGVSVPVYDFGTHRVVFWSRADRGKTFTPRLLVDEDHVLAQDQRPGRKKAERSAKLGALLEFNPLVEAFGDIEKNKTMRMRDNKRMLQPESDDYHVEMALNGFNPRLLRSQDANTFYMDFSYETLGLDGTHFAPDSTAYFTRTGTGKLKLTGIELRRRIEEFHVSPTAQYGDVEMYKPNMPGAQAREIWDRVKRIWRCNYFFFGEVTTHLTETHLNIEQYILPLMRNVRRNPVSQLLTPHLYGTVAINQQADKILTAGEGLVVASSAVNPFSVADVVHNCFRTLNWHGWSPREAVCPSHSFAHLQKLFWDVVSEHVDSFFEEHAADIEAHWSEIKLMSDELLANAVPYDASVDDSNAQWSCRNEVNKKTSPHPVVRGRAVALSPITEADVINNRNRDGNIANLKQLCRYLIFHSTLRHTYVNDRQFDLGGDPDFATLGLEKDLTNLENDPTSAVSDHIKGIHRKTTYVLVNVRHGYIMKDEDKDMHPKLKELLHAREKEFASLNLDIEDIRSCINI